MVSNNVSDSYVYIELTSAQDSFLFKDGFLPLDMLQAITRLPSFETKRPVIRMERDYVEEFRDFFTVKMAQIGFDETYEPNQIGQTIDGLIDTFYNAAYQ